MRRIRLGLNARIITGVAGVAAVLLPWSAACGQRSVTVSSANLGNSSNGSSSGYRNTAPTYSPTAPVTPNYNSVIQNTVDQINSGIQRRADADSGKGHYQSSTDDSSSDGGSQGVSSDSSTSGTGNSSGPSGTARANAPQEISPEERSQRAQQAMAGFITARQQEDGILMSEAELALGMPTNPTSSDLAYIRGVQPAIFPDVAGQYTSARGGGTFGYNLLDRSHGGNEADALDDGAGDDAQDAELTRNSGWQTLKDLFHRMADRSRAAVDDARVAIANNTPRALLTRYLDSDLDHPVIEHDPDIPIDSVDILRCHALFHLPYLQWLTDPMLDSAQHHIHTPRASAETSGQR